MSSESERVWSDQISLHQLTISKCILHFAFCISIDKLNVCEGELRRPANLVSLGSRKSNYEVIVNIAPLLSSLRRDLTTCNDAEGLSIEGKRCRGLFCVSHPLTHPSHCRKRSFKGHFFLLIYIERLKEMPCLLRVHPPSVAEVSQSQSYTLLSPSDF